MDEILVSINCITYNHEKYISETIDSFLIQKTNFKFEILIHDDASKDSTADIIRKYQKKYPDIIKPILQNENQKSKGIKNINYCFNHTRARGKYIAMCEGDDYWIDPYKLQKQVDYMESHHDCSMCFHAADIVKAGKGKVGEIRPYDKSTISTTEDIILGDGGFISTNSILYRKSSMDNAPDFYLNAPVGDYPLQILTSTKNYAYYIDEFMSVYRTGVEGSWTSKLESNKNAEEKIIILKKKVIEMLNELNAYTQGKYVYAINKKILINEFEILKIENKLRELKIPKYRFLYKSLSAKEKMRLTIKYYFTNICRILYIPKRYVDGKIPCFRSKKCKNNIH